MKFVKYFVIVWLILAVVITSLWGTYYFAREIAEILNKFYPPFGSYLIWIIVVISIVSTSISLDLVEREKQLKGDEI